MKWIRLTELSDMPLSHGALFRSPAKWPYEEAIEFMLCDSHDSESSHFFVVSSGYKAGLILCYLPRESVTITGTAVSSAWLSKNWRKAIYEIPPNKVFVCTKSRPRPKLPNI
jgi:Immunity protein 45